MQQLQDARTGRERHRTKSAIRGQVDWCGHSATVLRLVMGGLGGGSWVLTPGQTKGAAPEVFRQPHLHLQQQLLCQLCIDVSPLSIVIAPVHRQESIDLFQYLHTPLGQGL